MRANLISTAEAASRKGCSRQSILNAIATRAVDGQRTGSYFVIRDNEKFQSWRPNPKRQKAGRESQSHSGRLRRT